MKVDKADKSKPRLVSSEHGRQVSLVDLHRPQRTSLAHLARDVVLELGDGGEVVPRVVVHAKSRMGADQVRAAHTRSVLVLAQRGRRVARLQKGLGHQRVHQGHASQASSL